MKTKENRRFGIILKNQLLLVLFTKILLFHFLFQTLLLLFFCSDTARWTADAETSQVGIPASRCLRTVTYEVSSITDKVPVSALSHTRQSPTFDTHSTFDFDSTKQPSSFNDSQSQQPVCRCGRFEQLQLPCLYKVLICCRNFLNVHWNGDRIIQAAMKFDKNFPYRILDFSVVTGKIREISEKKIKREL